MPVGDWQFWIVTLLALGALVLLARSFKPKRRPKRTRLTIESRPVDRKSR